jgi:hypothetical protein
LYYSLFLFFINFHRLNISVAIFLALVMYRTQIRMGLFHRLQRAAMWRHSIFCTRWDLSTYRTLNQTICPKFAKTSGEHILCDSKHCPLQFIETSNSFREQAKDHECQLPDNTLTAVARAYQSLVDAGLDFLSGLRLKLIRSSR